MPCCANDHCSSDNRQPDGRYRRVLWVALVLNGGMFLTEIVAGLAAGSAALQADAVDFLSDAANYGISLSALELALVWRARAALVKGASMGLLGLWVAGNTLWHAVMGHCPQPRSWAWLACWRFSSTAGSPSCCIATGAAILTCARSGFARAANKARPIFPTTSLSATCILSIISSSSLKTH